MNKCTLIFIGGMIIATASLAFFNMMQMPGQMMQMGQQLVAPQPQNQPCNCTCTTP
jgi:hypothetical protein